MYRFSAHHSNLTHNIQQIKMKIFATSVVREKSKAEMKWHESYLESIGEIGKIFFLGLHNLEENSATLPRKLFVIWIVWRTWSTISTNQFDCSLWPPNFWLLNLVVQFGLLIWPSDLDDKFDHPLWPSNLSIWPSNLVGQFHSRISFSNIDRTILPLNSTDQPARSIWPTSLAC